MREGRCAMNARHPAGLFLTVVAVGCSLALAQSRPRSTAQSVRGHFASINHRVLEMAKDFPEDKYDYRLKPEMRSFGAVIVHIASGNVYAAKAGRGENVNWDELDPKDYKTKATVVALLEKSISDANATLTNPPDDSFANTAEPQLGVTEHSPAHYGPLVDYYCANGLVQPESW